MLVYRDGDKHELLKMETKSIIFIFVAYGYENIYENEYKKKLCAYVYNILKTKNKILVFILSLTIIYVNPLVMVLYICHLYYIILYVEQLIYQKSFWIELC